MKTYSIVKRPGEDTKAYHSRVMGLLRASGDMARLRATGAGLYTDPVRGAVSVPDEINLQAPEATRDGD